MAKEDLIPFNQLTEQEQKKLAQMGGKASVESRRKKSAMREIVNMMLGARADLPRNEIERYKGMGLDVEEITVQAQLIQKQIEKALEGDTKAFEVIRDTAGEKPKDSMSLEMTNGIEIVIDGKPKD